MPIATRMFASSAGASVRESAPAEMRAFEVNHWGARMRTDTYRGYNGYVIEAGRYRILFGGDTAATTAFRSVRTSRPVDLAVMPIGAYNPWIYYHCTPEQAWRMGNDAGAELFIPVHHQTFQLSREPSGSRSSVSKPPPAIIPTAWPSRRIGQEVHSVVAALSGRALLTAGIRQRYRCQSRGRRRNPLVVIVREAALEVRLEFHRAALHVPRPIRLLRLQQELEPALSPCVSSREPRPIRQAHTAPPPSSKRRSPDAGSAPSRRRDAVRSLAPLARACNFAGFRFRPFQPQKLHRPVIGSLGLPSSQQRARPCDPLLHLGPQRRWSQKLERAYAPEPCAPSCSPQWASAKSRPVSQLPGRAAAPPHSATMASVIVSADNFRAASPDSE